MLVAISALLSIDSLLRFLLLVLRGIIPDRPVQPDAFAPGAIVLISAHDEAGTIGETVNSLLPQLSDWPDTTLWVIADRCTDGTADDARQSGANVAIRKEGRIGKGAAIDWWLSNFRTAWQGKSAIILLDADSRLAAGSLRSLRNAIANGATAAQAFVSHAGG